MTLSKIRLVFLVLTLACTGPVVSGSAPCSENTYASSGAVLAFNPTAESETFGDNIARETSAFHTNLGPRTFNIAENGGFTAVFKANFGSSQGRYESIFAFADGDAGSGVKTNAIHCQGSYQTSNSYFSCKIYDQATVQCKIDGNAGTVTPNTDHSVVFRYDLASNQLYLKTDNSVKTQACSSAPQHSRTLPNTLLGRTWSSGSAQLNGKIYGLYAFDRALSDTESQQVLDGIVIGASDSPPQLECTPCPTDGTVVAGCSCPENTYASSGAVLAFNPSAAGETFDRSIPTEVDMGPVQWNVLDNGGVTLVSKLKFSASPSNYERVFAATDSATAGNALFQIMRRAETEAMFFIINDGDTSCLSDDIPITNEQWVTMLFQYDAATANIMVQLDGGTKHYKDCSAVAGFSAQNRLQNVNIFGRHGGSSPHFNGAIGGFYGFNFLLTSAQASLVLDSIVVGGDDTSAPLDCTPCPTDGTVVAGCSCPENTYESSALPENANVIFKPENNEKYFDGTRYEHLSDSTFNVATNGGFTVILKAKATQTASSALRILDFGETSGTYRSVIIARNPSNSFLVTYYDSANGHCGWYGDTDLPLTVDTEHTIVFRLDTSNQIVDVKIDDSLHKTMACSKGWDTVSKTVIGANRNSLSNKWLGDIYYVYVYDRYMDDGAVTSIVAIAENGSGCVPCPTDGTVVAGCSGTTEPGETDSDVPCCARTWPD